MWWNKHEYFLTFFNLLKKSVCYLGIYLMGVIVCLHNFWELIVLCSRPNFIWGFILRQGWYRLVKEGKGVDARGNYSATSFARSLDRSSSAMEGISCEFVFSNIWQLIVPLRTCTNCNYLIWFPNCCNCTGYVIKLQIWSIVFCVLNFSFWTALNLEDSTG